MQQLPMPSKWIPETDLQRLAVLGKLGEELCECGKMCFRSMIQGIDESDPKTGQRNLDVLTEEIADVLALLRLNIQFWKLDERFIESRAKLKMEHKLLWLHMLKKEKFKELVESNIAGTIIKIVSDEDRIPDTDYSCTECNSSASLYLCNSDLIKERPEAKNSDRWFCCDNMRCKNRWGEEHFQDLPDWIKDNKSI